MSLKHSLLDFFNLQRVDISRLQSSCQLASLRTDNKHIGEAGTSTLQYENYFRNSVFNHFISFYVLDQHLFKFTIIMIIIMICPSLFFNFQIIGQ